MNTKLPEGWAEGWKCGCGHMNYFSSYVYAHWDVVLQSECQRCSRLHVIHRGTATPKYPNKEKK